MNIEKLRQDRDKARKDGNVFRTKILNGMIDAVQQASISKKGRSVMTDQLVDEALIKYQKMVQEMIDTCPEDRPDILDSAKASLEIIKEYAPQMMTDKKEIISLIIMTLSGLSFRLEKSEKGEIMKALAHEFKGKADMKLINQIVDELLEDEEIGD